MALMQISQRTRTEQGVTKAALDQSQSLEVVQTMLHGGLSNLSYLRGFFAEKAYDERIYEMSNTVIPYSDYAAGKLATSRSGANQPSTVIRILCRGRSKRVDLFLGWLENGAFAALKTGNLRALQIYVHADPKDRQKVLETYTFTVKYSSHEDHSKTPTGIELNAPGNPLVSVQATNAALQSFFRETMDLCGTLPDLPEKRFVTMELFYHGKDFKCQGWIPGTSDILKFPLVEGWEKRTVSLKDLDLSFHSANFKTTALVSNDLSNLQNPFKAPLTYDCPSSRLEHIVADSIKPKKRARTYVSCVDSAESRTGSHVANKSIDSNPEKKPDSHLPATQFDTPKVNSTFNVDTAGTKDLQSGKPARMTQPLNAFNDDISTQSSGIINMKGALQSMLQPEQITQGDTQTETQSLHRTVPLSVATSTPTCTSNSPSKALIATSPTKTKPLLSPSKISILQKSKGYLRQRALKLANCSSKSKITTKEVVLCQCGHSMEEAEMVECVYCGTWQHLHCYGYTGADDPRLPDDHACYQCLLGDEDPANLKKLQHLAAQRRAMHFALQNGLPTQKQFAEKMGLKLSEAASLYNYLKNSGYVVPATGSHSAKYRAAGLPLFVAARSETKHNEMLQTLFDPLMHIAHHYQLPSVSSTQLGSLTLRLFASQVDDMPPPATPTSRLRKKNAITPASGLDLRASMTPYQTPSRPAPSHKRPQSVSETGTAAFSSKRLKRVQTKVILDASGLSSSPA